MTVVTCPIAGTWLVHDSQLPVGQTAAAGVAVQQYSFGYVCEKDGPQITTTCKHLVMVKDMAED